MTGRTTYIAARVLRGECRGNASGDPVDVVEPTVTITGPSGARLPAVVTGVAKGILDEEFVVNLEIGFEEPGVNQVDLEFANEMRRSFATYVAQLRPGRVVAVIEGVRCHSIQWTATGNAACAQYVDLDGGFYPDSSGYLSTLLRGERTLMTFPPGNWLQAAPHALWNFELSGRIERYADVEDGGVPVMAPPQGTFVPGITIAAAVFDERAWFLRRNALHVVAANDAGDTLAVVASIEFDAGNTIDWSSGVIAEGDTVYVLNAVANYRTRVCGFRLRSDHSAIDAVDSCQDFGSLASVSHPGDAWMGTDGLQHLRLVDGGLQEVERLATPYSWRGGGAIGDQPVFASDDLMLVPRSLDGGLALDAYGRFQFDAGVNDYAVPVGATEQFVWLVASTSLNGTAPKLTFLYER